MQQDPLAKWRGQSPQESSTVDTEKFRRIAQGASIENPAGDVGVYAAFAVAEGRPPERMEIRRLVGDSHAPAYRYLMNISYDRDFSTEIVLYYSFMEVQIRGRNLAPVVKALLASRCAFLQDYDAREYPQPVKDNAPVIEQIEVFVGSEMAQARNEGKEPEPGIVLEMDKGRGGQGGGRSH